MSSVQPALSHSAQSNSLTAHCLQDCLLSSSSILPLFSSSHCQNQYLSPATDVRRSFRTFGQKKKNKSFDSQRHFRQLRLSTLLLELSDSVFCVNNYTAGPDYSISLGILVDAAVIMSVSTLQRDTAFQARSLVCFLLRLETGCLHWM